MLEKLYALLLNIKWLNPYNLKPYDCNRKLKGIFKNKKVIISSCKDHNQEWCIQMLLSKNEKYSDYRYEDHVNVGGDPSLLYMLYFANKMVKESTNLKDKTVQ